MSLYYNASTHEIGAFDRVPAYPWIPIVMSEPVPQPSTNELVWNTVLRSVRVTLQIVLPFFTGACVGALMYKFGVGNPFIIAGVILSVSLGVFYFLAG